MTTRLPLCLFLILFLVGHTLWSTASSDILLPACPKSFPVDLFVVPPSVLSGASPLLSDLDVYPTVQAALDAIALARLYNCTADAAQRRSVRLFPTVHYIDETLRLTAVHSDLQITTMSAAEERRLAPRIARSPDSRHARRVREVRAATISGGVAIPAGNWTKVSANVYSAPLPYRASDVSQLFINNNRIVRSRVPVDQWQYLQYEANFNDTELARWGFQYAEGQFDYPASSLAEAMVVGYHSWTTSHHYIDRLIPSNRSVLFSNPCGNPFGYFGEQANRRFHIENLCEALAPNTFCYSNATRTLHVMTDGSWDPSTTSSVVTPIHDAVMALAGNDAAHPLRNVLINGIALKHSSWTIGRTQQADNQAASWLPTASLLLANATGVLVSGVEISHTGGYAVWLREAATGVQIIDCLITDTGAGGVRIGQMDAPPLHPTSGIDVIGNEISYGGNVFPDGVAVISHRATAVAISGNHVHHHRYTGVSVGWQWGYDESYTSDVLISGNYIHDIGLHLLNDQGGIYLLGIQRGTLLTGNVIHNVHSYACYAWGIYLDEGSSDVVVYGNLVYNTAWAAMFQHYGANNTVNNNVFARASLLPPPFPGADPPDGVVHISLPEEHISWTFAHNIVYDLQQAPAHPTFASQVGVQAPFNDNVWWNPYNASSMRFGAPLVTFAEWQKQGHDANSVVADPLFAGDVKVCDFFSVRPESPAALRGFVNISKPAMWVPGCAMDTVELGGAAPQFYQWHR